MARMNSMMPPSMLDPRIRKVRVGDSSAGFDGNHTIELRLSKIYGNVIEILLKSYRNSIEILLNFNRNSIESLHWISIAVR